MKLSPPKDSQNPPIPSESKAVTLLCSFFLPGLLLGTVLMATGIYPFGEKSLLIIDMNSEYVDYLAQMNESIRTGGNLLRTWNMGMGLNMLGLIAFYTASPFNLLVIAFPVAYITEALLAVTLLKIGLAGLLFALFTDYVVGRRGLFAALFSTAYALCAYNIAYASNIMWLDGVAFLPLVLLGAEKILREDRWGIFLFSLIYIFFTSYYIAYMIGVFSFLYFTCAWFAEPRENAVRVYARKLGRFLATAALATGCCAFLLLPAFLNLRHGQSEMWDQFGSSELDKPFLRILSRLLPGAYDSLTDSGYPNIYCTVLGALLCAVFFLHRGIPRRRKLVFGSLLGFLLLSFSMDFLDLFWHAFEDPTWFPARFSFLFSFLMLYLAMEAAKRLSTLSAAGLAGAVALLLALLLEIGTARYRHITFPILLTGGFLILAYALLGALSRNGEAQGRAATALCFFLAGAEIWGNAYAMERGLDNQFGYKTRESYVAYREAFSPAVELVKAQDPGAYRMEVAQQRSANGGMALGYNGISHYSTTTDQELNRLLRKLGYNKGTDNELRFAPSTPLTGGLLGIRYVLSEEELGEGYSLRANVGEVGIYENSCAFPLAFWAEEEALDYVPDTADAFLLQNRMIHSLGLGDGFFKPIPDIEELPLNADRDEFDGYIRYKPRVSGDPAGTGFSLHNLTGDPAYAYFPVWENQFCPATVSVDGGLRQQELRYRRNTIIPLGSGEQVQLSLEIEEKTARIRDQYFYTLDLEAAATAAERAGEHAVVFRQFADTRVVGTVDAPRDGALVTTFPLDEGWRFYLDGELVSPASYVGVFAALPLSAGEHRLEMRYAPPGFQFGCAVTALSAIAAILLILREKRGGFSLGKTAKKSHE